MKNRTPIKPEKIFYEHIKTLVENLLVKNKNYHNDYFCKEIDKCQLRDETIERAKYILSQLEYTKHLIDL